MNSAFVIFIVCTFANVVLSTIKSVATIKGGRFTAAFWNALSFGLYSYIVVLTAESSITTFEKVAITIVCNLVGVYIVKWVEEKIQKDKLWKVEMTIKADTAEELHNALDENNISNNYVIAGKYAIFNCYCKSKEETEISLKFGENYNAKTFASANLLI